MLKATLLAGLAGSCLLAVPGNAQEIRNIRCDNITLSWTFNNQQHAIVNAHNGCRAPMYVAVCIPLKSGRWLRSATTMPVPPNQFGQIDVGLASAIDERQAPRWSAWSVVAGDPCQ